MTSVRRAYPLEVADLATMPHPAQRDGAMPRALDSEDSGPAITDRGDVQRLFLAVSFSIILSALWGIVSQREFAAPLKHPQSTGFRVNVNRASADELSLLPQVGPVLADRIVAEREARGPFLSVDDIARTPGVGPARIVRLKQWVVTDD